MWPDVALWALAWEGGGGRRELGGSRHPCCEMPAQGQSWGLEKEPGCPHSLQDGVMESETWLHSEVRGERQSPVSRRLQSEDGDVPCSAVCSFRTRLGP